ncbi:MAG: phosphoribosylglycinamide formyltransferase [Cyclobacteriaceae bacterium]
MKKRIAIFASGGGTNAENFFEYFKNSPTIEITALFSNNPQAYALQRAKNHQIENQVFNRDQFYKSDKLLELLQDREIDFIVLAGFLWLVPQSLVEAYPDRIINIHPALLPKYGGKGMYGMHVHEAVKGNGETESGITIHLVNEVYDDGKVLFQQSTSLTTEDSPEKIAEKIHELEYRFFPEVVESYIEGFRN